MTATATTTDVVSPADVTSISFDLPGLEGLALRRAQSHDKQGKAIDGKFFHGFYGTNPKTAAFGVQLPALSPDLPTSVEIDGVTIALERGTTRSEKKTVKDGVTTITKVTPRPKASFEGKVDLPTFGTSRQVKVIVSVRQDETWHVIAMVTDVPTPLSQEERAARAKTKAEDNLAAIRAALGLA
jgi:hypothetical protein